MECFAAQRNMISSFVREILGIREVLLLVEMVIVVSGISLMSSYFLISEVWAFLEGREAMKLSCR